MISFFLVLLSCRSVSPDRLSLLGTRAELQEVCLTESFVASCGADDRVVVTQARYGRMSVGRCVETDYGNIGCSADVVRMADRKCSGNVRCSISVPDVDFETISTCPKDFKSYLLIGYACAKVLPLPGSSFACPSSSVVVAEDSGLIAAPTSRFQLGSTSCPLTLRLGSGRPINVTLLDFRSSPHGGRCRQYAQLDESTPQRGVRVCSGQLRARHVFTSVGPEVKIRMVTNPEESATDFLLEYRGTGCRQPEVPRFGWSRPEVEGGYRQGCNESGASWRIRCDSGSWYGGRHNCSVSTAKTGMIRIGNLALPYGLSIGIIIGLAVVIGIIILLVGLICIEWSKVRNPRELPSYQPAVNVNVQKRAECYVDVKHNEYSSNRSESAESADPTYHIYESPLSVRRNPAVGRANHAVTNSGSQPLPFRSGAASDKRGRVHAPGEEPARTSDCPNCENVPLHQQ